MSIDPLSALGFGFDAIKQIKRLVSPKISIEPKSFGVSKSDWDVKKSVVISNKTEKPLFNIQIVLWTQGEKPKVQIAIEEQEKGHQENIGGIDVNTDSFIIDGETNEKSFKLLQIGYLAPNSSRRFFITPMSTIDIKLEVVKFSNRPTSIARKEDSVAVPFAPPFNMKVKAISFLLKRSA